MSDLRNKWHGERRGEHFSGKLQEAIDGTADHYQVVHSEDEGTPICIHISDNINSAGQGAHKMFNGTIANVVMKPENREIVNINKLTSTKKPIIPFPPLVLAPLCLQTEYTNTFYESELKLVSSNFRPGFLMDLVGRSNIPLVQRQKQIPRRGVVQVIEPLDDTITPKRLVGLPLIEPTPVQTNRLYDTHDQCSGASHISSSEALIGLNFQYGKHLMTMSCVLI